MTAFTNNAEDLLLNFLFRNVTNAPIAAPTTWRVALHTADPGETGATAELPSANGYSRQSVTFAAPSGGSTSNTATLTFTSSGSAWGTITHVSVWDAASSGNCLMKGALSAPVAMSNAGDQLQITTGQLVLSVD